MLLIKEKTLKIADFVNIALGIIGGLLLISCLSFVFRGVKDPNLLKKNIDSRITMNLDFESLKKPIQFYERILSRRRLFVGQGVSRRAKSAHVGTTQFSSRISDFQLLGVISGAKGPQAIINDSKINQVYYCSSDEEVGGFYVKEVLPNKVILELNGEKMELRL